MMVGRGRQLLGFRLTFLSDLPIPRNAFRQSLCRATMYVGTFLLARCNIAHEQFNYYFCARLSI